MDQQQRELAEALRRSLKGLDGHRQPGGILSPERLKWAADLRERQKRVRDERRKRKQAWEEEMEFRRRRPKR